VFVFSYRNGKISRVFNYASTNSRFLLITSVMFVNIRFSTALSYRWCCISCGSRSFSCSSKCTHKILVLRRTLRALVKAFAVKQLLPLMSKYKQDEVTRLLRALGIKRRILYATWVKVDEQAHCAAIFTVHQRIGNLVIEKSTVFPCLLIWSLDFYWLNDCLRVLRILSAIFITRSNCPKIGKREISFFSFPRRLNRLYAGI